MKDFVKSLVVSIVTSVIIAIARIGLNAILSKNILMVFTVLLALSLAFLLVVLFLFIINKRSKNYYRKLFKPGMKFGIKGGGTGTFEYVSVFRPNYIHYITSDGRKSVIHYSLIYMYL